MGYVKTLNQQGQVNGQMVLQQSITTQAIILEHSQGVFCTYL